MEHLDQVETTLKVQQRRKVGLLHEERTLVRHIKVQERRGYSTATSVPNLERVRQELHELRNVHI
jgi:ABC-type uncharacterized transport system ATPase subunit